MEEMGMTDAQYKDHLRAVIADYERIKQMGVSEDAAKAIDDIIARYRMTVES